MDYIICAVLITLRGCGFGAYGEYAFHEARHTSERRWCLIRDCGKGEVAVLCTNNSPDSTKCVPCDPDAFYMNRSSRSTDDIPCYNKRVCTLKNGMSTWKNNDNTRNRQCVCETRHGYYAKHFDPDDPDYTADECFYCPENNSYVDPISGCVECHGRIYTDNHRYKHCSPITTSPDVDIHVSPDVGVVDEATGELDSHNSGEEQHPPDSGAWYYWVLPLIGVAVLSLTPFLVITVRRRTRNRALQLDIQGDGSNTINHEYHEMSAAEPVAAPRHSAADIEVAPQTEDQHTRTYNFVADPPNPQESNSESSDEERADSARRGGIHIKNYFAGDHVIQVTGDQNGMLANGNIEHSHLNSSARNGNTTRLPGEHAPAEHSDIYDSVYTVHEESDVHDPVEEVGEAVSPDHNTASETTTENRNTSPKRP